MIDRIKQWITINHQHVPIKEGESKKEVVSKFKQQKNSNNKFDSDTRNKKIKKLVKKGNTYIPIREGEDEKEVLARHEVRNDKRVMEAIKDKQDDRLIDDYIKDNERRNALSKFTRENKEQIRQWVSEFDDEAEKRVAKKVMNGEGLSLKEFYGYVSRKPRPGDIKLSDKTYVLSKQGKWEAINDYKKKKRSNH